MICILPKELGPIFNLYSLIYYITHNNISREYLPTVRLTSIYYKVTENQELLVALSETLVRLVKNIRSLTKHCQLEDTGLGEKGGAILRCTKKDFGAIPFFLVIADYKKAFLM